MDIEMNVQRPSIGGVGKAGIVFLLLFALPFIGFGLFAVAAGLAKWSSGDPGEGGLMLLFGALFAGAGAGIAALARRGRRVAKRLEERRARHPEEPWLWNEAWSEGRLRCSARAGMRYAWLFALAWNAVSTPAVFLVPGEIFEKGNHGAAIGLLFPAVGVGLLAWAVLQTLRWRRFGESVFEMARVPGVLGGELAGTLHVGGALTSSDAITARLSCIHRYVTGSGKNRSTHEDIRWSGEQQLPTTSLSRGPFGHALNLRFAIPYDESPSDPVASDDCILWRLGVTARLPGVDYRAQFEVPVFETGESQNARTTEALSREANRDAQIPCGRLSSGISVGPNERGDLEIFFPAGRHRGAALLTTLFGLVFGIASVVLYTEAAGALFTAVFAGFSALILYAALAMWAGSTRVVSGRGGVTVQYRLLGIGRSRHWPAERIAGVALETGMRVGSNVYWDLYLRSKDAPDAAAGRRAGARVGGSIRDKREAEDLAELLRRSRGL